MDEMLQISILELLEEQFKNTKDGYNSIKSEYWFGRLCECEDIKKEIINILNHYNFEKEWR